MNDRNEPPDPDDFFADTRMSFGDHLEDLRVHLWRAIKGFLVALVFGFWPLGEPVLTFITAPVEEQLAEFYNQRVEEVAKKLEKDSSLGGQNDPKDLKIYFERADLSKKLNIPIPPGKGPGEDSNLISLTVRFRPVDLAIATHQAQQIVGRRPKLSTLNVQEAFVVYFKVAIATALVLSSPWVFYQIWSFIAVGLYPHERRYINLFLPFSLGLFLLGVGVCQFLVMPKAVEALLYFNKWLNLEPDLRLNEWLGFAILMPVIFGISFQTPLVMLFLERIGVLTVESFKGKRRITWFLMAVFAAVITPSTDAFSMLFLWVPMCLLYELGIILCKLSPRQPGLDVEVPESDELVEV
jgi:sec-independent protein translocase protein TatC